MLYPAYREGVVYYIFFPENRKDKKQDYMMQKAAWDDLVKLPIKATLLHFTSLYTITFRLSCLGYKGFYTDKIKIVKHIIKLAMLP